MTAEDCVEILNLDIEERDIMISFPQLAHLMVPLIHRKTDYLRKYRCPTWDQLVFGAQCFMDASRRSQNNLKGHWSF